MTSTNCVVCPVYDRKPRLPEHGMVCEPCRKRLAGDLEQIVEEYALLDPTPGTVAGQRVSGTREAPLPGRLDVLNLLGPGAPAVHDRHGDQHGDVPTVLLLDQWVHDWRDTRGQREHLPVPTVVELAGWLGRRLDWATDHHLAIDEFAGEIRHHLSVLRAANGHQPHMMVVGRCPAVLDDGRTCGRKLRANPWYSNIVCSCGAEWRREQWEILGNAIKSDNNGPTQGAA